MPSLFLAPRIEKVVDVAMVEVVTVEDGGGGGTSTAVCARVVEAFGAALELCCDSSEFLVSSCFTLYSWFSSSLALTMLAGVVAVVVVTVTALFTQPGAGELIEPLLASPPPPPRPRIPSAAMRCSAEGGLGGGAGGAEDEVIVTIDGAEGFGSRLRRAMGDALDPPVDVAVRAAIVCWRRLVSISASSEPPSLPLPLPTSPPVETV